MCFGSAKIDKNCDPANFSYKIIGRGNTQGDWPGKGVLAEERDGEEGPTRRRKEEDEKDRDAEEGMPKRGCRRGDEGGRSGKISEGTEERKMGKILDVSTFIIKIALIKRLQRQPIISNTLSR